MHDDHDDRSDGPQPLQLDPSGKRPCRYMFVFDSLGVEHNHSLSGLLRHHWRQIQSLRVAIA